MLATIALLFCARIRPAAPGENACGTLLHGSFFLPIASDNRHFPWTGTHAKPEDWRLWSAVCSVGYQRLNRQLPKRPYVIPGTNEGIDNCPEVSKEIRTH